MKSKTALSLRSFVFFYAITAVTLVILLPLAGCGVGMTNTSGAVPAGAAITGRVHGGQQAVVGATVNLYAPGTGGYGSAPTLIASATTDGNGSFSLPGPYPHSLCPANSLPTYIVATGGDPGAGINTNLALAALLPACSSLTASTFVWISEVTTVAAAYALAPFASVSAGTTNIGTSSTNLLGLTNALAPATNLADTATGNAKAATSIPGLILPTAEINTLADILAACVNTNTAGVPSTTCSTLFTAATPPAGVAPTNTFQAAIDIALNPGNNAASLFGLVTPSAPFQPTLGTAPTDFAVGIRYDGGPIALSGGIFGIDIDASGNAWVAVDARGAVAANITEISPAGVILSGSTGYLSGSVGTPACVSIDSSGNVYITNYTSNSVAVLPPSGTGGSFLTPTSLTGPIAIAVDNRTTTTVWVGNFGPTGAGTTVSHITAAGVDATGSPYGSQDIPVGLAIDNTGNIWVANSDNNATGNGFLTKFTPGGGVYTPSPNLPTGAGTYPFDVAIDSSGNVWVTDGTGIAKFDNSGTQLSPVGGYSQSVFTGPESVIIDGLGRVWASNVATTATGNLLASPVPGSVTAFKPDGTLISNVSTTTSAGLFLGYNAVGAVPQLPTNPLGIAIDSSGNLWITGANQTAGSTQVVTELIGIAAPVVTPLSVASSTGKLGTLP